jgi:hypothetical protein
MSFDLLAKHYVMSKEDEACLKMVYSQVMRQGFASKEDLVAAVEYLPELLKVFKSKIGENWRAKAVNYQVTYDVFNDCVQSMVVEIKEEAT